MIPPETRGRARPLGPGVGVSPERRAGAAGSKTRELECEFKLRWGREGEGGGEARDPG